MTSGPATAAEPFDVDTVPGLPEDSPVVEPWRTVTLDPIHSGHWVVYGDTDGDGEIEIVSARNVNKGDVHFTSAACAQKLDGSVLWRWDCGETGRANFHHDVACQIHDWDGDGRNEVIVATDRAVVELDGATGQERRRLEIPAEASDCLVFANLTGGDHPSDFIVKTRYSRLWAYNYEGTLLWTVGNPGGLRTSHQPRPMDIDGDGRDEVMAGYAMLNSDGSVRWTLESEKVNLGAGHLDTVRVFRTGPTPADWRLVGTYCGANCIAMFDGEGKTIWEQAGHHFESINVARLREDLPGRQIVVDIDHRPRGQSPTWLLAEDGSFLGSINTVYSRHHATLDWDGDGLDELVLAGVPAIYSGLGGLVARLGVADTALKTVRIGDMTADGVPDIAISTGEQVHIFRNESGVPPTSQVPLGSGINCTLY